MRDGASAAAEEEPGEERARLRGGMIVSEEEEGRWVRAAAVCERWLPLGGALSRRALWGKAADVNENRRPLLSLEKL